MLSIFKHQWVTRTVLLTCLNVTRSCSQAIKFMCYLILPFAVPEHWLISPLLPFLIKEHFNTVRVTDTGSNHCPWGADIFTGVDLHTAEIQFQLRPLQEEGGGEGLRLSLLTRRSFRVWIFCAITNNFFSRSIRCVRQLYCFCLSLAIRCEKKNTHIFNKMNKI